MQGTFYGQQDNQDAAGACSYSANFANSNSLPWSKGTDMTVALNDAQWAGGAGCGLCVRFRGTGAGIGTTPISTSEWKTGFVNNRYDRRSVEAMPPIVLPMRIPRGGVVKRFMHDITLQQTS